MASRESPRYVNPYGKLFYLIKLKNYFSEMNSWRSADLFRPKDPLVTSFHKNRLQNTCKSRKSICSMSQAVQYGLDTKYPLCVDEVIVLVLGFAFGYSITSNFLAFSIGSDSCLCILVGNTDIILYRFHFFLSNDLSN